MRIHIGTGSGNPQKAVEEAVKNVTSPHLVLFLTSYEALEDTAKIIHEIFPGSPSIGAVGARFADGKVMDSELAVLGLFEDSYVEAGVVTGLSRTPVLSVAEIEEKINNVRPGDSDTVCVEFCTGLEERLATTLHAPLGRHGIPMIGGTVFNTPEGMPNLVAYNGEVYEDAAVYAIIRNMSGHVRIYKEDIYHRGKNAVPHFATKVNREERGVLELDGKPAADVFSEETGISKNKIIESVFEHTMGRMVGDTVYTCAIRELTPQGEMRNYKCVNKNDCMYFLELGDYNQIEEDMRAKIRSDADHISLVISVDCVYRYFLYQNKGYLDTYAKNMSALGPHIGLIGGGEQYNNQHINQSMVCAVFE